MTYNLPSFTDADAADSHTAVATLVGGGALPGFITFDDTALSFDFDPDDNSQEGDYNIRVVITDDDFHSSGGVESCEDTFKLTVEYTNHEPYFDSTHNDWNVNVHVGDTYNLPTMSDDDAGDTVIRTVD